MRKILPFFIAVLCMEVQMIAAQQTLPAFVSRLTAAVEGPSIHLTWKDPPETAGKYLIYRLDTEITTDSFDKATLLGSVAPATMSFLDHPSDDTPYFYAVVAEDATGNPVRVFVPFRNKTTVGAAVSLESLQQTVPVVISGIRARVDQSAIVLSFSTSTDKREISIYRGTQPITSTEDLLSAVIIDTIPSSQQEYRDSAVAGLDYYYALFDADLLREGKQQLNLSENVLASPIRLPLAADGKAPTPPRSIRNRPLPFLVLSSKLENGESLSGTNRFLESPKLPLSEKTAAAVRELLPATAPSPTAFPDAVVLPGDLPSDKNESPSELSRIIASNFPDRTWEQARKELKAFLLTRRPEKLRNRAEFYVGQTLYLEKRYREAFVHFLYASESFYAASRPWMDSILSLLETDNM